MRYASLAVAWLAACYQPTIKVGVPCGPDRVCPSGLQCDAFSDTCELPSDVLVWLDDTAADFDQPGASFTDSVVERAGFVGPTPWLQGHVRFAGIMGDTIQDPDTATWASTSAGAITGVGFRYRYQVDFGSVEPPDGLGLTATDDITVLVEGEIELDVAGTWQFDLHANDYGFLEIAPPGGAFTRLVADNNGNTTVTYPAPTPGWYRIRGAFADNNLALSFELRWNPPNVGGGLIDIPVNRMRVPVGDLDGLVLDGFEDGHLVEYAASMLYTDGLDHSFGPDPYNVSIGNATWSMRFAGQMLIDIEGDYAFRIDSHHGHRVWLDGSLIGDALLPNDQTTITQPIHLVAGWHDLVADLTKVSSSSDGQITMTVTSGPAFVGQTLPNDHLRPVVGRATRWMVEQNGGDVTIADGASATRTLDLYIPPGVTPYALEVGYSIDHPLRAQVQLVLTPPQGTNITLIPAGSLTGAGTYDSQLVLPLANLGSSWLFTASDTVIDAMGGLLTWVGVTLLYSGGVRPFPTSWRYESAPHDLGDVVGFGAVRLRLRQGTDAVVQLRTCDDPIACATEPWTDVVNGEVPTTTPRRFAQYAVSVNTDGDVPTALDAFELQYSARM